MKKHTNGNYWYRCVLALLMAAVVWITPANAAVFWDDEMEDGNIGFDAADIASHVASGAYTYDTSIKFSGSGSLRLNYPANCEPVTFGGGGCGGSALRPLPTPIAHVFRRVYFRMSGSGPNVTPTGLFETSINTSTKMLRSITQGLPRLWWIMYPNGTKMLAASLENSPPVPTQSTTNVFSSFTFSDNQWYCIETEEKMNTAGVADGIARSWVDGVLVVNKTDYFTRGSGDTSLFTHFGIFRQTGRGNIWWDRYAAGDTRIGCVGVVVDSTPPPVPSAPTVPSTNLPATINWSAVSNAAGDLAGYNYYRKAETCAGTSLPMALIAALGNVLTYEDTTIPSITTNICVKIASRDTTGNISALSTGADETLTPPAAPLSHRLTLFTYPFTGASSSDISSEWDAGYTLSGAASIADNAATITTADKNTFETLNAVTLSNNQFACAQIEKLTTNGNGGLILRWATPPTVSGYIFIVGLANPSSRILKATNGSFATLKSNNTYTWALDDFVCGSVDGTTLSIFKRTGTTETLVDSVTDSSYASGRAGLFMYGLSQLDFAVDNVSLGNLSATALDNSTVTSLTGDLDGADLTFSGPSYKIRYWNDAISTEDKVEVTGLGGALTYRLNVTWGGAITFVCVESQGADGAWEHDIDPSSYRCVDVIPEGDITAPDAPTDVEVY